MERNISFIVNRMNERVIAGQSIETLLAVLMFVLMGITLERSKIAEELLTTMARVFGPLPGGLAVSIVIVGAFLAASTGIVGATVVTMGLLALPTMLQEQLLARACHGRHRGLRHAGADHSAVDRDRPSGHAGGRPLRHGAGDAGAACGLFGRADLSGPARGPVGGHAVPGRAVCRASSWRAFMPPTPSVSRW
jgi:hypothetical protein